jgi:hypothetical protein
VFIGSSSEGLKIARAIQAEMDPTCEVEVWNQGVFGLTQGTLESLELKVKSYDFAVFVLTPDDIVTKRGETKPSARDNILFELGFFLGGLGRNHTFMIYDRSHPPEFPSDLAGVTAATFELHSSGNLRAALGAPCTQILTAIEETGSRRIYGEYGIGVETVREVIFNGWCEPTGSLRFTQLSERNGLGHIFISYGVNITVPWHCIKIEGSGVLSMAKLDEVQSCHCPGLITIDIPAGGRYGDWVRISGVRVQIHGTGLKELYVSISMEGNDIPAGQSKVKVVAASGPGIASVNAKKCVLDADASTICAMGEISITEGFLGAFVGWNDITSERTNGTEFRLSLSDIVPGMDFLIEDNLPNIRVRKKELRESPTTIHLILLQTSTRAEQNVITIPYRVVTRLPLSTKSLPRISGTVSLAPIDHRTFLFSDLTGELSFPANIPRYAASELGPIDLLEF